MNKLEKYSLDAVFKTLNQCSGIKICIVPETFFRAQTLMEYTVCACAAEIGRRSMYKLEFKNGSVVTFMPSVNPEQIVGRRFHQVFVDGVATEALVNCVLAPLTSSTAGRDDAIFKRGVFQLFDERDAVNQAASKVISLFSKPTNIYELQNALRDAKQIVEGI